MWLPRFASNQNFLTPTLTSDGKPYGPQRYEEIVKECYLISRYIHTSYNDLLDVTPTERMLLLKNISNEIKKQNERIEEMKAQRKK